MYHSSKLKKAAARGKNNPDRHAPMKRVQQKLGGNVCAYLQIDARGVCSEIKEVGGDQYEWINFQNAKRQRKKVKLTDIAALRHARCRRK